MFVPRGLSLTLLAVLLLLTLGCDQIAHNRINGSVSGQLICTPKAFACNGDVLEQCRDEGYGFKTVQSCTFGCNANAGSCNSVCRAGAKQCNGSALEICKADGSGWDATTCANGCNAEKLACNESCAPGQTRCNGDKLLTCSDGGKTFVETDCAYGCNATTGSCYQGCLPGSQRCDGTSLLTCNSEGTEYTSQACANGCNPQTVSCLGEISANAGPDKTIALGDTATLEGSATGGDGNYSYSWSDGTSVVGTSVQLNVSPTATTTYTLTVTDGAGNSDSDQVTVVVNPRLVADAGDDLRVLRGTTVTFNGKGIGGVGTIGCEWWTEGKPVAVTCDYTHVPAKNGIYVLVVYDEAGHKAQDALTVTIFEALSVSVSAKDPQLLAGQETVLVPTVAGGVPLLACQWDDPSSSTSCFAIKVKVEQTTTYTITVTDAEGNQQSAKVTVEVVPPLEVTTNETHNACFTSDTPPVKLEATPTGGIGAKTCEWFLNDYDGLPSIRVGDGCDFDGNLPDISNYDGDPTLTVIATDSKGNKAQATTQLVTASPLAIEKIGLAQTIFVGESATFSYSKLVFGGFPPISCTTSDPAGAILSTQCDDVMLTPSTSTTYTVTFSDGFCPNIQTKASVTVLTKPTIEPIADLFVGKDPKENRVQVTFTVTNPSQIPDSDLSCEIVGIGAIPCKTGENTTTIVATQSGSYEIKLYVGPNTLPQTVQTDSKSFAIKLLAVEATASPNGPVDAGTALTLATKVADSKAGNLECTWVRLTDNKTLGTTNCTDPLMHNAEITSAYRVTVKDLDTSATVDGDTAEVAVNFKLIELIPDQYVASGDTLSVTAKWEGGKPFSSGGYFCVVTNETTGVLLYDNDCAGTSLLIETVVTQNTTISITVFDANQASPSNAPYKFVVNVLEANPSAAPKDPKVVRLAPGDEIILWVNPKNAKGMNFSCVWTGTNMASGTETSCTAAMAKPDTPGEHTYSVVVTDNDTGKTAKGSVTVLVYGALCNDKMQNGFETDIDCGGGNSWLRISEIHYDNASTDVDEGVEVMGPAGMDITRWQIVPYNGNGGTTYSIYTFPANTIIPGNPGDIGFIWVPIAGLQNDNEAIALVDPIGRVVEFLSYEAPTTPVVATNGPANGMTAVDIGVNEPSNSPVGESLQLVGQLSDPTNLKWVRQAHTRGTKNTGLALDVEICQPCQPSQMCKIPSDCTTGLCGGTICVYPQCPRALDPNYGPADGDWATEPFLLSQEPISLTLVFATTAEITLGLIDGVVVLIDDGNTLTPLVNGKDVILSPVPGGVALPKGFTFPLSITIPAGVITPGARRIVIRFVDALGQPISKQLLSWDAQNSAFFCGFN